MSTITSPDHETIEFTLYDKSVAFRPMSCLIALTGATPKTCALSCNLFVNVVIYFEDKNNPNEGERI